MKYDYDIIFIGGAPGAYVGAIRASQLGKKDAIIEKDAESQVRIPSVREVWQKNKKIWKRWLLKVGGEGEGTQIIEVKS